MNHSIPKWLFLAFYLCYCSALQGQQELLNKKYQFIAYELLPTWKGLISDWDNNKAKLHLFDVAYYKGHGNYVCHGLKTGLKFNQFKELVRHPAKRQYLPIFLYDLQNIPIKEKGQHYTWAVRLEDYSYTDDKAAMEETFIRLMQTVEAAVQSKVPHAGKGIAILSSLSASLPNMTIREGLERKGYKVMTLSDLIAATKKKKVPVTIIKNSLPATVLNEGTAVGYLRWIKQGSEKQVKSNFKDILFYQNLPTRVPIANGILTIEPQTPFSHINLLAKNRGTINAYLTAALPDDFLEHYQNRLVKIVAQKIQGQHQVTITKISEEVAKKHWAKQQQLKLSIPEPDLSVQSFSHFNTGAKSVQTIACIGAKASNYALLYHHLPEHTRLGFAIPFYFYVETIQSSGAAVLIEELLKNKEQWSPEKISTFLKAIRQKITTGSLKEAVFRELEWIGNQYYKGKKIRLRSSTNCEDLPQFNGAGLYVSKGYWQGSERAVIKQKLLEVYASLWLDKAFEEREFFGIDQQKVAMGILINEAFPDEYANGVALTLPNLTGAGSPTIYINSQYGETAVTNPIGNEVPEIIYFRQLDSKWYVTESKSSLHNIFVETPFLTPLVRQLQQACAKIDTLLKKKITPSENYGVDVEFKIMKEDTGFKLYIKQARLLQVTLPE